MTTTLELDTPLPDADLTTLYRLGVQTDALRDATKELLSHPDAGPDVTATIVERYRQLRTHLAAASPTHERDAFTAWVPELDDDASVHAAFLATAALAAFVDTTLGETAFVTSYRVREHQIGQAFAAVSTEAGAVASLDSGMSLVPTATGPGQYL